MRASRYSPGAVSPGPRCARSQLSIHRGPYPPDPLGSLHSLGASRQQFRVREEASKRHLMIFNWLAKRNLASQFRAFATFVRAKTFSYGQSSENYQLVRVKTFSHGQTSEILSFVRIKTFLCGQSFETVGQALRPGARVPRSSRRRRWRRGRAGVRSRLRHKGARGS